MENEWRTWDTPDISKQIQNRYNTEKGCWEWRHSEHGDFYKLMQKVHELEKTVKELKEAVSSPKIRIEKRQVPQDRIDD